MQIHESLVSKFSGVVLVEADIYIYTFNSIQYNMIVCVAEIRACPTLCLPLYIASYSFNRRWKPQDGYRQKLFNSAARLSMSFPKNLGTK